VSDITSRNSAPEARTALPMAFDVSPSTVETSTYLHSCELGVLSIYKDVTAHVIMPKLDALLLLLNTNMSFDHSAIRAHYCHRWLYTTIKKEIYIMQVNQGVLNHLNDITIKVLVPLIIPDCL
jgi:hypothetical protein